jgi:hypothetical protein
MLLLAFTTEIFGYIKLEEIIFFCSDALSWLELERSFVEDLWIRTHSTAQYDIVEPFASSALSSSVR